MELRYYTYNIFICFVEGIIQLARGCESLSPHELPNSLLEVVFLGSSIPFRVMLGHLPHPEDQGIWDHLTSALPPKSADLLTASVDVAVLLWHLARRGEEGEREKAARFQASPPQISAGRLHR